MTLRVRIEQLRCLLPLPSQVRRTISTFSCDIAYSESPAASRVSSRPLRFSMRITARPRKYLEVPHFPRSAAFLSHAPLNDRHDHGVSRLDQFLRR
jgi:hypothetical protein